MGRRHPDVRDDHIRPKLDDRGLQRLAVRHRGHDLVALLDQQLDEPHPHDHRVLRDHYPHEPAGADSAAESPEGGPGSAAAGASGDTGS